MILRWENDVGNVRVEIIGIMSMQSARLRAFSALIQTPGLVSIEPVYLQGIGLAAIAAGNVFGIKVGAGIILPLPLMVMMTGRGVRAGSTAIASSAIWACWRSLAASQRCFTCFSTQDRPFFFL